MSQGFKAWWHEMRELERRDARYDLETPARIVMCRQRKEDQLRRARDAGLLDEQPLVSVMAGAGEVTEDA
jgi:hypothetical protein